jgi:hypothetical protein
MSLRDLARAFLESEEVRFRQVSHMGQHMGVPLGQTASTPYSSMGSAVPLTVPRGTLPEVMGQAVPLGQCGTDGTNGTDGTLGTDGTAFPAIALAFDLASRQREADRRNEKAVRERLTDRWCACGARATFAWPDGLHRDVWRCLDCGPVKGEA